MTAILVAILGGVAIALGVGALITGRLTAGVPRWPLFNALVRTGDQGETLRPVLARLVGLMLLGVGGLAVWRAVATLMS